MTSNVYGCETWVLTINAENQVGRIWKKDNFKIFGPWKGSGIWRNLMKFELYYIYGEPNVMPL